MDWTKDDLHANLLIWCANADFIELEEENEIIFSQIDPNRYKTLKREFKHDIDYQRVKKIKTAIHDLNYSADEINLLIDDMRELFNSNGHMDSAEQAILIGLKHLL
ncbi:hypothetical protein OAU25_01680 [Crocinitomicaceae bacterium]|nr:hypothetical protein [Crocinitomicaceae bacterium]